MSRKKWEVLLWVLWWAAFPALYLSWGVLWLMLCLAVGAVAVHLILTDL